ncbi:MAG: hypothetical protein LJE68_17140, partial [Rhodobacter sp.]|nr:hypothetical protein [Rhodobacter sp.]
MTSPFVAATLSFAAGRVAFQGATGLKMPFSGAVVIPRPPGETPQPDQMTAQQSLFVPLRFPKSGTGGARLFPTLRTMDGARLSLTGPVLIFVAEDPGLFDEFDLGSIFSQGTVLTPQFPTTGTLTSARPKYLVLSFSGGAQPADAIARAAKDGQDLSGVVSGLPASFSGTLMAFDFAGLEIEADAALAVLGETNVTGAPGGNDVRVQFVDILGKPLAKTALFGLTLDPAVQGADNPRNVYTLAFPGAGRTLKLRVTDPIPASVSDAERYLWRNIKVAVWPGRQARLTPVTPNNPDLDIAS